MHHYNCNDSFLVSGLAQGRPLSRCLVIGFETPISNFDLKSAFIMKSAPNFKFNFKFQILQKKGKRIELQILNIDFNFY